MRHRDYSSRRVYRLESQDCKPGREDSHGPFREKICRHLDTEWSRCPNSLTQACQNTNYSLGLHCDVPMIPPKRRRGSVQASMFYGFLWGQLAQCSDVTRIRVESTFVPCALCLLCLLLYPTSDKCVVWL